LGDEREQVVVVALIVSIRIEVNTVRYGIAGARPRNGALFDHVTASACLQSNHVQLSIAHLASIPRRLPLTLKSPLVSPQNLVPMPRGSPTLTASSCQDNCVRDASPVEPSLETTYRQSRILWIVGLVFSFRTFPCLSFISELPLSLFSFTFST